MEGKSLLTGAMVDLMCSDLTFCQCFFSKETREFSCRMDILDAIVLSHSHVADTNRQAEHLMPKSH